MYKLIYLSLLAFISLSCEQRNVEVITAERLKVLQSEGVLIIDIRTLKEFEQGHIPGVEHLDYYADGFLEAIVKYKDQPLVIHCAAGGRSKAASNLLLSKGFEKIYDYSGGFSDWKRLGEKIEE